MHHHRRCRRHYHYHYYHYYDTYYYRIVTAFAVLLSKILLIGIRYMKYTRDENFEKIENIGFALFRRVTEIRDIKDRRTKSYIYYDGLS